MINYQMDLSCYSRAVVSLTLERNRESVQRAVTAILCLLLG